MTEQPMISDELRANLVRAWALGFLEAMAGREVNDNDTIPTVLSDSLIVAAQQSIEGAEHFIAEVFMENPSVVYRTAYNAGYETSITINGVMMPMEVNLN